MVVSRVDRFNWFGLVAEESTENFKNLDLLIGAWYADST